MCACVCVCVTVFCKCMYACVSYGERRKEGRITIQNIQRPNSFCNSFSQSSVGALTTTAAALVVVVVVMVSPPPVAVMAFRSFSRDWIQSESMPVVIAVVVVGFVVVAVVDGALVAGVEEGSSALDV